MSSRISILGKRRVNPDPLVEPQNREAITHSRRITELIEIDVAVHNNR